MEAILHLKENLRRLDKAYPDVSAGLALAGELSDCIDIAIGHIWQSVGGESAGTALVAIGGYGRRQMCPKSDIDLLVVSRKGSGPRDAVRGLSYALWDTGFELGLSSATDKEAHKLAAADFDTRCAYLDSRLVYGDAGLFHDFHDKVLSDVRRSPQRFTTQLREVCQDRWLKAGDAGAELEPDLKRSKGGLRDIAVLGWISKVTQTEAPCAGRRSLERCLDLLLTIRQGLHLETGRPTDTLSMQLQIPVAKRLGTDEYELMRRLYESCRPAAFAAEAVLLGSDSLQHAGDSFCAAFRSDSAGPDEYRTLTEWPSGAREAFFEILRAGERGRRAFRRIDVTGALPAALPEWRQIRHRAQRNIYHRWSVDVHSFETVCRLHELKHSDDELIRQVAADSRRDWDSLLLAALLHDIGKGGQTDHSLVGERLADSSAERIGIRASAGRDVSWLVRHHLYLTQVATRRDISEEALIVDFAERVGSERRLRMLYLLSIADARATGPAAWTAWKANLVSQLFSEVHHLLERKELVGGGASRKAARRATELKTGLAGFGAPVVEGHLAAMPRVWLLSQSPAALVRQSELMLRGGAKPVKLDIRPEQDDGLWEVTVVAPDMPGLFSKVSGVLALHGYDVVAAQVFTREDGLALEIFSVEAAPGRDDRFDRVAADAERAVSGSLSLSDALSRKRRDYSGRIQKGKQQPPEVIIDNRASDFYTVIEVHATDRIGLLYEITSTLADLGVDIHLAKVATYAEDVVDSFYVRDLEGQKITDQERLREMQARMREALLSSRPDSI